MLLTFFFFGKKKTEKSFSPFINNYTETIKSARNFWRRVDFSVAHSLFETESFTPEKSSKNPSKKPIPSDSFLHINYCRLTGYNKKLFNK